ncbi:FtsX-like permease family [uncultured Roseburia sp.]|uniref:ABC transporter permease n=1 Tax=Brotonthovivens ammoniilytica TaxID=2981725 RepID=A0ABT2TJ07_9FIRM|nr:ABC transporter permease [Brotonthovivens ammoniilytica]MCU6762203.1 ABC transporter permease [Brotonthovivens ammoniilytica]SCI58690.1 FtsX-like permease family [uncultured Roseburia sp.]
MKKGFYRKFAVDCIRKNRKMYIPYLLTCIIMVTLFYIIQSLSTNTGLDDVYGATGIIYMLNLGTRLLVIFSAIFLFYTNNFLTKQRRHEFGIYNVLGLEKRHIAKIIFHETVIIAGGSIICGILAGILLYKLAFAGLMKLLNTAVPLGFEISADAVIHTVILFAVIHLILFLNAFRQIRFSNTIALLGSSNIGEKEPKSKWLLAVIGVISLVLGYGISIRMTNPLGAFSLFFLAVLLVIIGTYCLFTAGSIIWLKSMRKKKSFYYRADHFISISGMIYRMKQNAASLASICILSTMVIVAISTTLSMYSGCDNILKAMYPREVNTSVTYNSDNYSDRYFTSTRTILQDIIDQEQISVSDTFYITYLGLGALQEQDSFLTNSRSQVSFNDLCVLDFITLDDYNRITGEQQTLDKNEILLYQESDAGYPYDTLKIMDRTYKVKQQLDHFPDTDVLASNNAAVETYYIVTDSQNTLLDLYYKNREIYGENASDLDFYYGFDLQDDSKAQQIADKFNQAFQAEKQAFLAEHKTAQDTDNSDLFARLTIRDQQRGSFYSLYGGMFFIGIFLSMIFLIATILIIYYKQISEGLEDARRFEIMQKVGLTKAEIKKSIRSQVLMVFFLPLVMAGIHSAFAFPIISRMLRVLAMTNVTSFIFCLIGTFAIFAVIYIIIYMITAKSYYKIVSK